MANTFLAFAQHADFNSVPETVASPLQPDAISEPESISAPQAQISLPAMKSARLVYEINIHLPVSRDPAVYDALFGSLSKHLNV